MLLFRFNHDALLSRVPDDRHSLLFCHRAGRSRAPFP